MGEPSTEVVVFAGESYVDFAKKFAFHLGCELSPVCHKRFNDAEYQARIGVSV
jgi:phosphoribosylpyrophosphate synthetase